MLCKGGSIEIDTRGGQQLENYADAINGMPLSIPTLDLVLKLDFKLFSDSGSGFGSNKTLS